MEKLISPYEASAVPAQMPSTDMMICADGNRTCVSSELGGLMDGLIG